MKENVKRATVKKITVKKTTRPYDSSGRQANARRTRRTILEAATRLFTRNGYGATTLQAIADEAGVSVQTIYATLKNKRTILGEALDIAISGDDEPVVVNDRDWMHDVFHAASGAERLQAYARAVALIMESAGQMFVVVGAAAASDPDLAELEQQTQHRRRQGAARVIDSVREVATLADALTPETATDILWLLNSPSVYQQMVVEAGWPIEDYTRWLGDVCVRELLRT